MVCQNIPFYTVWLLNLVNVSHIQKIKSTRIKKMSTKPKNWIQKERNDSNFAVSL